MAKWQPFSLDYISSHFSLLLRNNHLPHIRFHELRHSCASLLLNSRFTLKNVQEYMGILIPKEKIFLLKKITASNF